MMAVQPESLKRWTVREIRRMIEAGSFDNPERFELVEGLILDKMGQNAPHRISLSLALEAMRAAFAGRAFAVAGVPLPLSDTSEPEPDVMVRASDLKQDVRQEDVLDHVHPRRPVAPGLRCQARDLGAEQHGLDLAVERGCLREDAERVPLQLAFVVLEEDERLHNAFFSWRNARIFSAAVPSSSILTVSPRAGGSPSS